MDTAPVALEAQVNKTEVMKMKRHLNRVNEIRDQAASAQGFMNIIMYDIDKVRHEEYNIGKVQMNCTKGRIHDRIVALRGELLRLDEMVQELEID